MYYVMDAHSFYNFIYFIFLIIVSTKRTQKHLKVLHLSKTVARPFCQVGSFFMINLCLVVIATQFSETKQREHALMKSEQHARQLHQSASTLASDSQPGSCYEEIIRYLAHLGRKAWRRLSRCIALSQARLHCACVCRKGSRSVRGGGVGEMNGLANRHSGHAPNDLSHLHQVYHLHHHHHQLQQPQMEMAVNNGGNGFNYPFISPLLSYLDDKDRDQKRMVARETINRLPQLVLEHSECIEFVFCL